MEYMLGEPDKRRNSSAKAWLRFAVMNLQYHSSLNKLLSSSAISIGLRVEAKETGKWTDPELEIGKRRD